MADTDQIKQVYQLEALGAPTVIQDLDTINNLFKEIKKNKIDLDRLKVKVEDPTLLADINRQLAELKKQEADLTVEMKRKQVVAKELQITAQIQANQAKADAVQRKQDLDDQKGLTELRKQDLQELQIQAKEQQIARAKELADQRALRAGNQALAGSYNDISKRYRELLSVAKNTTPLGDPVQVAEAAAELRKLKDQVDAFNRSLTQDGTLVGEYTTGILQAFKKLGLGDLIEEQATKTRTQLRGLDTEFERLRAELLQIRAAGGQNLGALENQLIENRAAAGQLEQQLNLIQQTLAETGNVGTAITSAIGREFSTLKDQFATFVVQYLGFQAAIDQGQKAFQLNLSIADKLTDLGRILAVDELQARKTFEALQQLDTRTGIDKLLDISIIAAKAGTAPENIAGVTKAIDELGLVAGNELGNIDETVTSIIKLINVFEGPGKVTEQSIRQFGNALVELANKGVASGGFLVDYAQRLAGIEGITKIEIKSVLGLAAAFEEQGQSAEVAAGATTQILLKIGQDVDKFAGLAKMSSDSFRTLLRENPAEALISLAQGVKGNETAFDVISQSFSELELKGIRVTGILGVLADKSDFFRQKIQEAGVALENTSAITDGAAAKQNNLAGSFERLYKSFERVATSNAVQITLGAIAAILTIIANNFGVLITLGALYATGVALQNAELVVLNVQLLTLNARLALYRIVLAATTIAQTAYNLVMQLTTRSLGAATVATGLLGNAMRLLPLGIILTAVGVLAAAFSALATAASQGTAAMREQARLAKLNADLQGEVNAKIADAVSRTQSLVKALLTKNIAHNAEVKILNELKTASDGYLDGLTLQNLRTAEGIKLLNGYVTALRQKAQTEAATANRSKLVQDQLENDRQAERAATDPSFAKEKYAELSADGSAISTPFLNSLADAVKFGTVNSEQAFLKEYYRQRAEEITKNISFYDTKITAAIVNSVTKTNDALAGSVEARRKFLEAEVKSLEAAYGRLAVTDQAGRDKISKQIAKDQEELNSLKVDPKDPKAAKSSRLTGPQKDTLADASATRDTATAEEDARFEKLKQDHRATEQEEVAHLERLRAIRKTFFDATLSALDGSNAAERVKRAEAKRDNIKDEGDTQAAIYKVRLDALNAQREKLATAAKEKLDATEADPEASDLQKAAARANYYQSLVTLQENYNTAAGALDRQYTQDSEKNEQDRQNTLVNLRRQQTRALQDVNKEGAEEEIREDESRYNDQLVGIFNRYYTTLNGIFERGNLSLRAKQQAFRNAETAFRVEAAQAQIVNVERELATNQALYDNKLIQLEEYNKKKAKLEADRAKAEQDLLTAQERAREESRRREEKATQAGYNILNGFISAYVDNQNKRIEKDYQAGQTALQTERDALLAKATSDSEKLAINKEFDQKQEQLDKERFERQKQLAIQQLALEFAVASIKALSTSTTVYDGLINEGIVLAEYLAKLAVIESSSYEKGGSLGDQLQAGGVFNGPAHSGGGIRFFFKGGAREVEGNEGYVINKKSMGDSRTMTVTGTPRQIASAANVANGGVNFAPGFTFRPFAYGGYLGSGLQPPVFNPSSDGSDPRIDALFANTAAMQAALANLQVKLVPQYVADANNKRDQLIKLGTL